LAQAEVAQFVDEVPPELIQDEDLNVGTSTLKGVSKSGVGNGKVVVGEGPAGGVNSTPISLLLLVSLLQIFWQAGDAADGLHRFLQGVHSIIPEFVPAHAWAHADAEMRRGFSAANENYAKTNAKKYKAQGTQRKELNAKSQKVRRDNSVAHIVCFSLHMRRFAAFSLAKVICAA